MNVKFTDGNNQGKFNLVNPRPLDRRIKNDRHEKFTFS